MANFIDRKEETFRKQLEGLSDKCKQNEILNIIGIIGDDLIEILKGDRNEDVIKYIESLKERLYKRYDELEVKDEN